jgi:hypothetical protein
MNNGQEPNHFSSHGCHAVAMRLPWCLHGWCMVAIILLGTFRVSQSFGFETKRILVRYVNVLTSCTRLRCRYVPVGLSERRTWYQVHVECSCFRCSHTWYSTLRSRTLKTAITYIRIILKRMSYERFLVVLRLGHLASVKTHSGPEKMEDPPPEAFKASGLRLRLQ